MNKDYILLIHKYAAEHLNENVQHEDLYKILKENNIDTEEKSMNSAIEVIIGDVFVAHPNFGPGLRMKSDAYYRHLDYLELGEARHNSQQAMKMAIIAIVISAVLAIIQIVVAIFSIN